MYSDEFTELDNLLASDFKRSCFSLNYAEINKMCDGNYSTAIVLSRLLYWWRAKDNGEHRFKATLSNGTPALAKSREEMAIETGLSPASVKRAYDKLIELNLISIPEPRKQFMGHPTNHILLNEPLFVELFWSYYKEIQLELAEHHAKKYKDNAQYLQRIEQLKDPAFDPRADFPTPTPKKSKLIEGKFPRETKREYRPPQAPSEGNRSRIIVDDAQIITEKKNTPINAPNIDKSEPAKMPRKIVR